MVAFTNTECNDGYWVEQSDGKKYLDQTIMKPRVNRIEGGSLSLGMDKGEIKKLFGGEVLGGWQLADSLTTPASITYTYNKTIKAKDGTDFCDEISINLIFNGQEQLIKFNVDYGGCNDSAC